jgi:predicted methyltransferase
MLQRFSRWTNITPLICIVLLTTSASALDKEALQRALEASEREVSDRIRDNARKPIEVLDFLGLDDGMQVLDVYSAGGYFTYILSKAVGPSGIVFAQTPKSDESYQDSRTEMTQAQALDIKIEAGKLSNVVRVKRPMSNLGLEPESLDLVLLSQIFHDYHNASPASAQALLRQLLALLKSGGVVGVIDHTGLDGLNNQRMHRMLKDDAINAFKEAGFIVEAESDLLANPQDSHRRSIFDPALQRSTDQFLFRARKP